MIDAERTVRSTFTGPRGVAAARGLAADVVAGWGLHAVLEDAVLVVSELASNAVIHGAGDTSLTLERDVHHLRITVHDSGGGTPTPRDTAADEPSGRGLRIVERLATQWGFDVDVDGTVVWAEIPVTG